MDFGRNHTLPIYFRIWANGGSSSSSLKKSISNRFVRTLPIVVVVELYILWKTGWMDGWTLSYIYATQHFQSTDDGYIEEKSLESRISRVSCCVVLGCWLMGRVHNFLFFFPIWGKIFFLFSRLRVWLSVVISVIPIIYCGPSDPSKSSKSKLLYPICLT